eukprot:5108971-Pleurochrysis_carterae.AAC.1
MSVRVALDDDLGAERHVGRLGELVRAVARRLPAVACPRACETERVSREDAERAQRGRGEGGGRRGRGFAKSRETLPASSSSHATTTARDS